MTATLTASTVTLAAVHRLRYEVYCLERRYVAPDDCPGGLERDRFDSHAVHFAVHTDEGQVLATARLVLDSTEGLPLESQTGVPYTEGRALPRVHVGELSRLIVARETRVRAMPDSALIVALLERVLAEGEARGLRFIVAGMEHRLWRLLRRLDFVWSALGPPIDYYGEILPCFTSVPALRAACRRLRQRLARLGLGEEPLPIARFAPTSASI